MIKIIEVTNSNGRKRKIKKEEPIRRVTNDFLQDLIDKGVAIDISNEDWKTIENKVYNKMYFSTGNAGIDGGAFMDEDGNVYVIMGSCPLLYKVFQMT